MTPASSYQVPAQMVEVVYEIKKSRFIARGYRADSRQVAMSVLEQARMDYPDARHHCWAYLIGSPSAPSTVAMSDDGEPSGTAGKPILNVLQHKDVGNIMLVVIRYFGGIKLGAGGLVRAYSQAAQMLMDELPRETLVPKLEQWVSGDFSLEQPLRHWLEQSGGEVLQVDYGETIRCQVCVPEAEMHALVGFVTAQGGRVLADK